MKTNRKTRLVSPLFAMAGLVTTGLQAAPVIEESFDYATGNVSGKNGGTGFTGAWSSTKNNPTVSSPDRYWGELVTAGNYARGGAWSGVIRPIGTTLADANLLDDGATLWFSVVFDLEGQNTSNADINVALCNATKFNSSSFGDRENLDPTTAEGIGVTHSRAVINAVHWKADGSRTEAASSLNIGAGRGLIVGRIDWGATALDDETITLYGPGKDLASLGAPILAATATAPLDQATFNQIAIQFKDNSQVDEIRFGATSADVIPANGTAPTVVSIEDDVLGGPIFEDFTTITYTVTFDQPVDGSTIDVSDFATTGTATNTIDSVTEVTAVAFEVVVTPTSTGDITLEIPIGATILDFAGVALDTSVAIPDDTTITITAGTSPAMTFLGTTDTDWNDVTNWDGGANPAVVPFGAYPAIIDTGVTAVANDSTIPSYSGGLTFLSGSELDVRTNSESSIGTGPVTFNTGSVLRLRSDIAVTIPGDISMAGDATITNSSNTADNETRTLSGVISGSGQLTVEVRRGNTLNITGTNTWSGGFVFNYVDNNFGNGSQVRPVDDGFGTGDVTINDGLQLYIQGGRTDTIDDSASLFLNGRGRAPSNNNYKLRLDSSETVNELWLDNTTGDGTTSVQMPAGDYTATTSPAAAGGGTILDSNGDPLISGSGTLTVLSGGAVTPPFDTWVGGTGTGFGFDEDKNGDGVDNGLAFLLGAADPDVDANDKLPAATETAGGLVLTFEMLDSASRGTAALSVQHSSDLGGTDAWAPVAPDPLALVPDTTSTVGGVDFVVSGSGTLTVEATIPAANASGGKLFGRLLATE